MINEDNTYTDDSIIIEDLTINAGIITGESIKVFQTEGYKTTSYKNIKINGALNLGPSSTGFELTHNTFASN